MTSPYLRWSMKQREQFGLSYLMIILINSKMIQIGVTQMKWLLITTTENRNTGDELIRIGVQNLIREVDPSPEFTLLDKEKWPEQELQFDKCVLCGMPLFWNSSFSHSQLAGWWGAIFNGWVTKNRNNFLILGAGDVVSSPPSNPFLYGCAIQEAVDKSFAVTTRNFVSDHRGLIESICPAAFAVKSSVEPKLMLCNFMPHGAHDRYFNEHESDIWIKKTKELSDYCMQNNFRFIEHCPNSYNENGRELGWPEERIIRFNTAEEYLPVYAQTSCFFGNRLHGALVTAAIGRPAIGVGYESRLKMVSKVGGMARYPSEITTKDVDFLVELSKKPTNVPAIVEAERKKLTQLIKRFMEA